MKHTQGLVSIMSKLHSSCTHPDYVSRIQMHPAWAKDGLLTAIWARMASMQSSEFQRSIFWYRQVLHMSAVVHVPWRTSVRARAVPLCGGSRLRPVDGHGDGRTSWVIQVERHFMNSRCQPMQQS